MTTNVEELIRRGGAVLAFDTNVLRHHKRFLDLCDRVKLLNASPGNFALQVVVPAVAHGEHVLHIRHSKGPDFKSERIWIGLQDKGVEVRSFDGKDAESVAELIGTQFSDDAAWQAAKRKLAGRQLGLSDEQLETAKNRRVGATVDWLIAGQTAANQPWILVTNDKGMEFQAVARKISLENLEALLGRVLEAQGTGPAIG
jgi:hypothetical protein